MNATHNLKRFINAQDPIFAEVLHELQSQKKITHWMWFIFPQLIGLGSSQKSRFYGIHDLVEAEQYWDDPTLRDRLRQCLALILHVTHDQADRVFGQTDAQKLQSSLTLFEQAAKSDHDRELCVTALEKFFSGARCERTLHLLASRSG